MYVFISYSRGDKYLVLPLIALLRCAGLNVFVDVDNIEYGLDWKEAILQAVEAADRMILMWSESASKSEWVLWETSEATKQEKLIVPVMLDDTPLPPTLKNRHGCSDLEPLVSSFKSAILATKSDNEVERFYQYHFDSAQATTVHEFFTHRPIMNKRMSIWERIRKGIKPRAQIDYEVQSRSYDLDIELVASQFAKRAVEIIYTYKTSG